MDKNFKIHIDIWVMDELSWSDMGSAKVEVVLPLNHIPSLSFENMIHEMIDEAYANHQQKVLERENSERNSAFTDEE